MTLALYRKYRPRTFAEVIGQEHVTEPLSQALRSGRLNHAYLFSGPRGCGKTSSARILARSLNCEQGPTPEPCGVCDSCKSLATDGAGSIDVLEIDAASHGGVDDARELRERAFFAPASSRFKIYVIDEAHMVSSAGFNALLKLVEEPPDYVKFIFATTEPEKVLGTIKSRTHHYPFRLIPPGVLRPYLEQLASAEGVKVESAVFPLVVRAGGGSARDSLSVLDQLIAGAGPEGVSYARAVALLGVTDAALLDEMCDALAAGDGAAAYATVDRVAEAGHDARRFAADLLERMRDLIVLQKVPDAAAKGLIDGPADQIERMAAQAERLGPATLSRCADIVHNGLVEMRGTTAPRLLLELICARMLLPGADDSSGGLLQRLERMERRLTLSGGELPPPAAGSAPAAAGSTPPVAGSTPAAAVANPAPAVPRSAPPAAAGSAPVAAPVPVRPAPATESSPAAPDVVAALSTPRVPADPAAPVPAQQPPAQQPPAQQPPARRPVPPEAVMPDPATPEPARPGTDPPGELDAAAMRRDWNDVVGMVNRTNKKIAALMRDAVVRELDGDTLVLTVKSPWFAQTLTTHASVLTDALYEQLGGRWQIRCEVAGDQRAPSSARSTPGAPPPARGGSARPAADRPPADGPSDGGPADGGPAGGGPAGGGPAGGGPAGGGSSAGGPSGGQPAGGQPSGGSPVAEADDNEWPEPARPGGGTAATTAGPAEADGEDWPEPARPGGVAPAGPDNPAGPGSPAGPGTSAGSGNPTGPGSSAGTTNSTATSSTATSPTATNPTATSSTATSPTTMNRTATGAMATSAAAGGTAPTGSRAAVATGPAAGSAAVAGAAVAGGPGGNGSASRDAPNGAPGNGRAANGTPGGGGSRAVSSGLAAARAAAAGRAVRTPGAGARAATTRVADSDWAGEPPYDPDYDGPAKAAVAGYEGFDPGDEPTDEVIDERTARQTSEQQAVQLLQQTLGAERISESPA